MKKFALTFGLLVALAPTYAQPKADDYGALRQYAQLQQINQYCKSEGKDLSIGIEDLLDQKIIIMKRVISSEKRPMPKEMKDLVAKVIEDSKSRNIKAIPVMLEDEEIKALNKLPKSEKCQATSEYIDQNIMLMKFMIEKFVSQ